MEPQVLRNTVKSYLLAQIQLGRLHIGKTINLAALARETGISVTPIREALSQLEHAQIIKAIPNRGFVVLPLGKTESKHLYGTVSQLEAMALEATEFSPELIQELRDFMRNESEQDKIKRRFEFHSLLVSQCPNPILLQILEDLRARLSFYERSLLSNESIHHQLEIQGGGILDALAENNLPTAALILKMHWMTVLEHVQKQLATD